MITIHFPGAIPSKKNQWKPNKGGKGIHLDRGLRRDLDGLILLAKSQWRGRSPVIDPDIAFRFWVSNVRQDRDNLVTTLLDVLVKAGILANDNIACSNGRMVIEPAEPVTEGKERVEVEIGFG